MITDPKFEPGSIPYDTVAPNYPAGRALSPATADLWTGVIEPLLPGSRPVTVLDLGCGTGRFAGLMADRFGVRVIGCDPSFGMLKAAQSSRPFYSVARGEAIPLASASCDIVWMSQMIHHVADRNACAREVRRVIRPDGKVIIRGGFGDRMDGFPTLFRFFPEARRIAEQIPTLPEIAAIFRAAGLQVIGFQCIQQQTAESLREFADRTRKRADMTLVLMPDAVFERRQSEFDRIAAAETMPEPVIESIDMIVLKPRTEKNA